MSCFPQTTAYIRFTNREIEMTNMCTVCGEPAFAYREEKGGGKSFLCEKHISMEDVREARVMADEGKGTDGSSPR